MTSKKRSARKRKKYDVSEVYIPPAITVSTADEFFIAVCNSGEHSYVVAGVKQKDESDDKHFRLLAGAGKFLDTSSKEKVKKVKKVKKEDEEEGGCKLSVKGVHNTAKVFFGNPRAFLANEHLIAGSWFQEGKRFAPPFSRKAKYSAYTISFAQYLKLVDLITEINPNMPCYRLDSAEKTKANKFLLKYGWGADVENVHKKLKTKITHINMIANNCRTSALDIVDEVAKPLLSKQVTGNALAKLPLSTRFHDGVADYLYILPAALDATKTDDIHPAIRSTLATIYKRLDDMLTKATKNKITKQKFELLKSLYNELLSMDKQDIQAFKDKIDEFLDDDENKQILYKTREPNIFGRLFKPKTSTENMFIAIDKKITKKITQSL